MGNRQLVTGADTGRFESLSYSNVTSATIQSQASFSVVLVYWAAHTGASFNKRLTHGNA